MMLDTKLIASGSKSYCHRDLTFAKNIVQNGPISKHFSSHVF